MVFTLRQIITEVNVALVSVNVAGFVVFCAVKKNQGRVCYLLVHVFSLVWVSDISSNLT